VVRSEVLAAVDTSANCPLLTPTVIYVRYDGVRYHYELQGGP
jgi:hypothetical protein